MQVEFSDGRVLWDVTESSLRGELLALGDVGRYFVTLTREDESYLQAAGNRAWCTVERRQSVPLGHFRAYQHAPSRKFQDGAKLATAAGEITLRHDEWILQKNCIEIFVAFLKGEPLPSSVGWRSMNDMFGI